MKRSTAAHESPSKPRTFKLYTTLPFVMVRAPLFSIDAYLALASAARAGVEVEGDGSSPGRLPGRYDLHPENLWVRRALAVGAPGLIDALARKELATRKATAVREKLLTFLIRMSTRPTPYGLFAGVALATWGNQTDLSLAHAEPVLRTRPDMEWLYRIVALLEGRREIREHLCVVANPAARIAAGRVFLAESVASTSQEPGRQVSIRATRVVREVLELARHPVLYREVVNRLRENRDAPRDKVERLLDELLEQTFLFTDLRPPHGGSPAHHVMRRLAAIESARTEAAELASLLDAAAAWDHLFDSSADDAFRSLVRRANAMVPAGNAFQVDMALPLAGRTISRAVGDEISRAAEMLIRLTPLPHGPTNLADYRQRFETRYGQHREVPILELLDPQLGLGPPQAVAKPTSQPRDDVLTRIALHALRERKRTVELDEATLADLATWDPKPEAIPLSLDLNVFVSASSVADLDAGRFQVIVGPNIGSNGAGRSLGRFGELLGPLGVEAIRNAANAEESRDPRIWAELYHVPAILRSANVTIRPAVRSYEILLGGVTSGNAQAVTIPLHELLVGVHAGRFYVRWSAVDADVVICTGDMLNHALGPEIIRFLWGASRDGLAWLSPFDWGPARGFPYLPRVQSGRIVLGSAEWRVGAIFDRRWRGSSDEAISVLRQDWQLPRYVFVSSGDNRLLIDLEDPLQRALVTRALTDPQYRQHLVFHEVLPTPDEVWMPGPGGRYVAELVASLTVCNNGSARPVETRVLGGAPPRVTPSTEARLRPPGSDWLFVKLYGPPSLQEDLITAHILGFVEDASAHGLADMWFFVRYADPDPHIRLRFQGVSAQLTSKLFPVLCRWVHGLIEHGLVHRVSFDTYDRELERYGGEAGLAVAESIFAADSRAVARLLVLLKSGSISIDRTTLAVLEVDDLLESLGLDEPTRLAWLRDFSSSRKESNEDYRRKQSELRSMLSAAPDRRVGNNGDRIAEILVQRQLALRDAAHSLHRLHVAGGLCCHLNEILRSLIHMSLNRLLGIDRLLEQKVLGLLLRTRESLAAHRIPQ